MTTEPTDYTCLAFYSQYALYPLHWEAFRLICTHYRVRPVVITTPEPADIPSVHRQLGWVRLEDARQESFHPEIHVMPAGEREKQKQWLTSQLDAIHPDVIWVQEEPHNPFLLTLLRHYWFRRTPRILTAVCENIFPPPRHPLRYWLRRACWSRLNGLLATASASIDGVRRGGMPCHIPTHTLVAGAASPPTIEAAWPIPLARETGDFLVGFVGRICEEKGWQVLLEALRHLPSTVKCALVGDGPQVSDLQTQLSDTALRDRVAYLGLLPKADLWRAYAAFDCLVLPSLTRPTWKEQFGGVLADGMAMGLPLIGSDSGSIPEVIGPAGLITPEGDVAALATAIGRLASDPMACQQFSAIGRQRFADEFSIPAYAQKIAAALGLIPCLNAGEI